MDFQDSTADASRNIWMPGASDRAALPDAPEVAECPDVDALTREQRRSRRKRTVRSRSISVQRLAGSDTESRQRRATRIEDGRPSSRGECIGGPRPCPFVSCKYHLYIDVSPRTGSIKLNFPDLEVWDLSESCVLDVADREGSAPEHLGLVMNLTRERIRQLEVSAFAKIEALRDAVALREFVDGDGAG
ncbi:MAG TPA: hypothetical protein VH142_17840 [Polyangiaceae bacterium]|jgi:hypothetical protein|nr:hypothetical protein [Polyangiaceae bacterium]